MQESHHTLLERDVVLLAVSVDTSFDALQMAALIGASFPVLADPSQEVTRSYRVFDLLGDGVAAPATFIIGKEREVLWSYIGQDIGDRPSTATILDQIETLVSYPSASVDVATATGLR